MLTSLAAVPWLHVACGTDWSLCFEHLFQRNGVLKADRLPNVLDNFGHVQGDDDPSPFVVFIKQRWIDYYSSGINVTLHQPNQLSKKVFPAALPGRSHQVVNLARSFKYNSLHSEPS